MDMRPLRQMRLKQIDAALKRLIFGFDLLVYVPQAKTLTPIAAE